MQSHVSCWTLTRLWSKCQCCYRDHK